MRGIETLMSEGTTGLIQDVAQIAWNHLALQILPHINSTCRCRKASSCSQTLGRNVRFAIMQMEARGARSSRR